MQPMLEVEMQGTYVYWCSTTRESEVVSTYQRLDMLTLNIPPQKECTHYNKEIHHKIKYTHKEGVYVRP